MDKKRTLILTQTDPKKDAMFSCWMNEGYNSDITFKSVCKILRALRRIWILAKLPGQSIWYGDWKKELLKYDTIILHMEYLQKKIPSYIHRKKPDMRVICWYWNKVNKKTIPPRKWGKNVEYWTFNQADSEKYHMKLNIQYYVYPSTIVNKTEDGGYESDILFVGHSHGRSEKIKKICIEAEKRGLVCDINIIDEKRALSNDIPYTEVQKKIINSKAILEVMQDGQNGYTLRTMESLFFSRKLITDNKAIMEAPFYNKNNIFVIDVDSIDYMTTFLNLPYDGSVRKYQNEFNLNQWFHNFT